MFECAWDPCSLADIWNTLCPILAVFGVTFVICLIISLTLIRKGE